MQGSGRTWLRGGLVVAGLLVVPGVAYGQAALEPDVIYHGGKIVTVNENFDIAQAVAVRDGRFIAVGSDEQVRRLAGPGTRLVDLGGKTVLPGFNDSHAHLFREDDQVESRPKNIHDLRHISDLDELLAALREIAARTPRGQWIQGRLSETGFPDHRLPTRWELDRATPHHPLALPRGPHTWVVNSLALQRAGITRDTPDPEGGQIDRAENGDPNGVLREGAAQRLVERLLPPPEKPTREAVQADLRLMLRNLVSLGITSANIAGLRPGEAFWNVQDVYARWGHELPRLTIQLRVSPGFDSHNDLKTGVARTIEEIRSLSVYTGFGDDRLKIGAIKMSVDGGFTGSAAKLLEPYPDGTTGAVRIPAEALYEVARF
ncbi:MAG TPA: amidohydrolase family protein, partial [Longimicrobiales bacterium]